MKKTYSTRAEDAAELTLISASLSKLPVDIETTLGELGSVLVRKRELLARLKSQFNQELQSSIEKLETEKTELELTWKADVKMLTEKLEQAVDSNMQYKDNAFRLMEKLAELESR